MSPFLEKNLKTKEQIEERLRYYKIQMNEAENTAWKVRDTYDMTNFDYYMNKANNFELIIEELEWVLKEDLEDE